MKASEDAFFAHRSLINREIVPLFRWKRNGPVKAKYCRMAGTLTEQWNSAAVRLNRKGYVRGLLLCK